MKTKFQWRLTPGASALSAAAVTKIIASRDNATFKALRAQLAMGRAGELAALAHDGVLVTGPLSAIA